MSVFSSYSKAHGNVKDWTGVILSPEDAQLLLRHGIGVHSPIGAEGYVGEDGTELVLRRQNPSGHLSVYSAVAGKLIFAVDLDFVRRRTVLGERPLTRADDISVTHLQVVEREGRLLLISTARSVLQKARKRDTGRSPAIPATKHEQRGAPSGNARERVPFDVSRPGLITKWGDDLGLRVPHDIAAHVGLAEGTRVDIEASDDGRLTVRPSRRHFTLDELLAGMTPEREHALEDDGPRGEELI